MIWIDTFTLHVVLTACILHCVHTVYVVADDPALRARQGVQSITGSHPYANLMIIENGKMIIPHDIDFADMLHIRKRYKTSLENNVSELKEDGLMLISEKYQNKHYGQRVITDANREIAKRKRNGWPAMTS